MPAADAFSRNANSIVVTAMGGLLTAAIIGLVILYGEVSSLQETATKHDDFVSLRTEVDLRLGYLDKAVDDLKSNSATKDTTGWITKRADAQDARIEDLRKILYPSVVLSPKPDAKP